MLWPLLVGNALGFVFRIYTGFTYLSTSIDICMVNIHEGTLWSLLMSELFKIRDRKYNLRNRNILVSANIKTTTYGTNSINHLAPKIWSLLPEEIKYSASLDIFKRKFRLWTPEKCPCPICKPYIWDILNTFFKQSNLLSHKYQTNSYHMIYQYKRTHF